jgi:uncharacterized protein (TIGR00288 family)
MSQNRETNLALFIDFDNVALGARDARQRFDIKLLIQRILEKGKIIVKKAYADWHYYKEHMTALHESAIELIEVPMPRISGKNSADIRLVVDAMDLCYSKDHIDTFVIVSGDSDFSPLVSKLRENNKRVIGVGMKNSSSHLLIGNCDEFIFYDDIYNQNLKQARATAANVPGDKRELFDFLVSTVQSLLQESRGTLYSSLIKDTMTRKQPDFNERAHGYATFGDLLEEARRLGLLVVERDARAGGTWVVQGLAQATGGEAPSSSRSSRRRRRSGGRGGERRASDVAAAEGDAPADAKPAAGGNGAGSEAPSPATGSGESAAADPGAPEAAPAPAADQDAAGTKSARKADARKADAKKAAAKKTTTKKTTTKKATTKKAATKKATTKKASTKKAAAKKTAAKKTATKKAATRKTTTKKATTRKAATKKAAAGKTTTSGSGSDGDKS